MRSSGIQHAVRRQLLGAVLAAAASSLAQAHAQPTGVAPTLPGAAAPGAARASAPASDRDAQALGVSSGSDAGGIAAPSLTSTAGTSSPAAQPASDGACQEHLPQGKARPAMQQAFPERGVSGHHAILRVSIEHGLGERVLPAALQVNSQSAAAAELERAGFLLPHWKGPGRPRVGREEDNGTVRSTVELAFVPLPKDPGRHELTLPPVPIAMSRASGEVITLCTDPHRIVIDDPVANVPNPNPKGNPAPLRQREFWSALRNAVYGGIAALTAFVLGYLLLRWYQRRPKPAPPPPPPRPPWEVAMESFRAIRLAQLVEQQRYQEHFDRVTHTLRQYLGDRFGFDALESTTTEIMIQLSRHPEATTVLQEVKLFLEESDLVRFADVEPTEAQCRGILDRSEQVVQRSVPEAVSFDALRESTSHPLEGTP